MTETQTPLETPALPAGATALPDGQWVVLRDHRTLDGGDVMDVLESMQGGQGYGKASTQMRRTLLQLLIKNWSFEHLPLPATEAALRRLPGPALMALFAAIKPAFELINGTSSQPVLTEATLTDPASPTPGSSE